MDPAELRIRGISTHFNFTVEKPELGDVTTARIQVHAQTYYNYVQLC